MFFHTLMHSTYVHNKCKNCEFLNERKDHLSRLSIYVLMHYFIEIFIQTQKSLKKLEFLVLICGNIHYNLVDSHDFFVGSVLKLYPCTFNSWKKECLFCYIDIFPIYKLQSINYWYIFKCSEIVKNQEILPLSSWFPSNLYLFPIFTLPTLFHDSLFFLQKDLICKMFQHEQLIPSHEKFLINLFIDFVSVCYFYIWAQHDNIETQRRC